MISLHKSLRSKASYLVFVVTFFCLMFSFLMVAGASAKRIGVTEFETNGFMVPTPDGGGYDIGLGASDILTSELSKNKSFEVVERNQIRAVLQEQAFENSGAVNDSTAAQIGQLVGLKYMVYGKILSAGASMSSNSLMGLTINQLTVKTQIAVRMIDTATGVIVWSDTVDGTVKKTGGSYGSFSSDVGVSASTYDEALNIAIKKITKKIADLSPIEGTVIKASGKKVYLDIGVDQGVQVGQTYSVYREGAPITTADGQILGVEKDNICTIKIASVEGPMSIGEVKDKGTPVIQQGDKVRAQ